jgi:hypothetical protein
MTDGAPRNVSALSVVGSIFPVPNVPAMATCAELIVTEFVPYAFDKRTRKCCPPSVTCTNCRNVLLASGAGGRLLGSVNCGPHPHVVTQCPCPASNSICTKQSIITKTIPVLICLLSRKDSVVPSQCKKSQRGTESLNGEQPTDVTKESLLPEGLEPLGKRRKECGRPQARKGRASGSERVIRLG